MSKACLTYNKGMHFDCVSSAEFSMDKEWYRVECYLPERSTKFTYAGYKRVGAYWRPITSMEQPTNSPIVIDRVGNRLVREARAEKGGELSL